jgi:6-pyruvoyl-tetrahydropterin synthase
MIRLFVEQLTVLDCAFLDPQRGLVGESWIVDVELAGDLDQQSMVLDFGEVKKRLKKLLDGIGDHQLLVPHRHAGLKLQHSSQGSELYFSGPADGPIEHRSPADAVCVVDAPTITTESLTAHLQPLVARQVPSNVAEVRLILRNEVVDGAYYHYAHGLKKHTGHCQRIAHGHRSRIEIRLDGQREAALEQAWAARWKDIYLGTQEDIVMDTAERVRFEYTSVDGDFALELPAQRCELLDGDTTVEKLARHIAQAIHAEHPGRQVEVRAYEGVLKGAVARAG